MLGFLFTPQEGINYDFIYYCYSVCTLICAVLVIADLGYKVDQVKGFYIIFAPFLPCWIWSFALKSAADKKASSKPKKD